MTTPHDLRRGGAAALSLLTLLTLGGCSGLEPIEPFAPITDPAALFMALTLDHGAVNLAVAPPYDTDRLTATPRDAEGNPFPGLPAPTFRSSDTTRVWVTPEGVLQARAAGLNVRVIAELRTSDNILHADTALVNVSSDPAPRLLDTLSIHPLSPEDTIWSMNVPTSAILGNSLLRQAGLNFAASLTTRAVDASGEPVTGLTIEYKALDPELVRVHPTLGSLSVFRPGEAVIVARTRAYGVTRADTARFTITPPAVNGVLVQAGTDGAPPVAEPLVVTVRPGGYVFWRNFIRPTATPLSVTFDDPTNIEPIAELCAAHGAGYPDFCASGDIAPFATTNGNFFDLPATNRGRYFPVPGVYPFRIEPLGVTGRVIVSDELP
jgi:hypothetical protein